MLWNVLTYVVVTVFVIAIVARAVRIIQTPMHLRWELYPVPHEGARAKHGGSRLEDVDWWTKPHHPNHMADFAFLMQEILLLKGIWEHNRKMWFPSWGMHFGLYMLIVVMIASAGATVLDLVGVDMTAPWAGTVTTVFTWVAVVAYILGAFGTIQLFFMRLTSKKLKMYNTTSHYFNLLLIMGIFITGIVWFISDPQFSEHLAASVGSVLVFGYKTGYPTVAMVHILVVLFFLLYLPFTHMTHFFTKYFMWHDIRWEDAPNQGDKMRNALTKNLTQKPTWAAPHIQADGSKTWVDLVGFTGGEPAKKDAEAKEK